MSALELAAPFVGAIALEVFHWYGLRERLDTARYRRLLRSRVYWIFTVLAVVVGGAGALIYFGGRLSGGELLVAGAAFPTLLKKLVGVFVKERTTLGDAEDRREPADTAPAADYFAA
jgi:hypothetical protein